MRNSLLDHHGGGTLANQHIGISHKNPYSKQLSFYGVEALFFNLSLCTARSLSMSPNSCGWRVWFSKRMEDCFRVAMGQSNGSLNICKLGIH